MFFKKKSLIASLLLLVSMICFADIGENYKKSGLIISGSGSIYNNFGRIFADDSEYNYFSFSLYPSFDYFIVDNFSIGFVAGLRISNYIETDGTNQGNDFEISLGANTQYSIVNNPDRDSGFVPSIGTSVDFSIIPVSDAYQYFKINMNLTPYVRFNFFLNDRLAPFISTFANMSFLLAWNYEDGTAVDYVFSENIQLNAGISFGISFFIPNNKKIQF